MHPILTMTLVKEWNSLHLNVKIPLCFWRFFTYDVHVNKENIQRIGYNEHTKVASSYLLYSHIAEHSITEH